MFKVGDKIVYPMHGAGTIEGIEEKDMLGELKRYYILRISSNDMRVMLPVDSADLVGVRDVSSPEEIDRVLTALKAEDEESQDNWNRRYKKNMDKIKSGDILEIADVVRELIRRDHKKSLSTGEKKMLNSARQILISELVLVKKMSVEKASEMIEDIIMQ